MTCGNLATKAELAALEQRLTALLSAKIDKGERQSIVEEGGQQGFQLSEAKILPVAVGAVAAAKIASSKADFAGQKAQEASRVATTAKGVASEAKGLAASAQNIANAAKGLANSALGLAKAASSAASKALGLATIAQGLAKNALGLAGAAKGLASQAIGLANTLMGLVRALDAKMGGVLSKLAALTGKVLNILNAVASIFSIIATLASLAQLYRLTQQVNALEQKVNQQQLLINGILAIVRSIQSQIQSVGNVASDALSRAISALSQSAQALSQSSAAISSAQSAINASIRAARDAAIAIATATAVASIANAAMGRANQAWDLANRAFNNAKGTTKTVIQRFTTNNYIDRTITRVEQRNFIQRIEGRPGRDGAPGRPGRDGRDGRDMAPVDLSDIRQMLRRIDGTTTRTDAVTTANLAVSTQTNTKVGVIDRTLNTLNEFSKKAWQATRMDKVLNALNTVLLFHNAAMLSRNLAVTLGDTASTVLNAFGVRDENNQPLDVNTVLGKKVTELAKTVLGAEVYNDLSKKWQAASRIMASASRMLDIMRSMIQSVIGGLEVIGRWIALIGNGAQRDGLFSEGVFPWANENPNFKNPFFNYVERLERLEDAASSINELASEVVEGKELIEELRKEKKTLTDELDKGAKELGLKEEEEVTKSKNPDIEDADLSEAEDND